MMPEQQYDYSDPEVAIARVDSLKGQLTKTYKALYKSRELVAQRDTTITEMRELLEKAHNIQSIPGYNRVKTEIRDYLNKTK